MKLMTIFGGVAIALIAACGNELSPADACKQSDETLCERIYACYTPGELAEAGYPAEESACITMFEEQDGCSAKTTANACNGNATFHGDQAATCVTQIANLQCSQIRDSNLTLGEAAPACGKVCSNE